MDSRSRGGRPKGGENTYKSRQVKRASQVQIHGKPASWCEPGRFTKGVLKENGRWKGRKNPKEECQWFPSILFLFWKNVHTYIVTEISGSCWCWWQRNSFGGAAYQPSCGSCGLRSMRPKERWHFRHCQEATGPVHFNLRFGHYLNYFMFAFCNKVID